MTFTDFLRQRFGPNWVLAKRRTPALKERYDAVITPRAYDAAATDYLRQYGPSMSLDEARSHAPSMMPLDEVATLCGWTRP